jgi:hypothetical protein
MNVNGDSTIKAARAGFKMPASPPVLGDVSHDRGSTTGMRFEAKINLPPVTFISLLFIIEK